MKLLLENWNKFLAEGAEVPSECGGEEGYYHSLPSSDIRSVLRSGIRIGPSGNESKFGLSDWSSGKSFISIGYSNAVKWQLQIEETTGEAAGIVQIELPDNLINALKPDTQAAEEGDLCSFYLEEEIPPNFITLLEFGPSDEFEDFEDDWEQ
jgi:hypothetical protein